MKTWSKLEGYPGAHREGTPREGAAQLGMVQFAEVGFSDLRDGFMNWRIWHLLGAGELRRRYARSRLGQFWLTLSTGFTIALMAIVWSVLFRAPLSDMLPYMAVSMITWQFISGIVSDSANLFPSTSHLLLSQHLACSTVVYASLYRNLLILLHNLAILPIVFLVFRVPLTPQVLLVVPALVLVLITSAWVSYVVGAICTRFRDFSNVLNSLMQLAFYVTPVIWKPGFLGADYQWILLANPFAHFLTIVRGPILGEPFAVFEWCVTAAFALGGLGLSLLFIGKYRRRLLYWI